MIGYYGAIDSPHEAIYEKLCAMDNQDVPLEECPDGLISALSEAGFAIVPVSIPFEVLGDAAISMAFQTGNPKHMWDYIISRTKAYPKLKDSQP